MPTATAQTSKVFKKASEGTHQSVLNSIDDLGKIPVTYNGVTKLTHMIRLFWQIEEKDDDGSPLFVTEKMSLSLHEKSKLYARVKGLFGKTPPSTLDTDRLIGTNTNLVIVHNPGKDKNGEPTVYANIAATLKLRADQKKLEIIARKKSGTANPPAAPAADQTPAPAQKSNAVTEENPISDQDLPW